MRQILFGIFFILFLLPKYCFSQIDNLTNAISTAEYYKDGKKRRDLLYNKNLELIQELYYDKYGKVYFKIKWGGNNNIETVSIFKFYPDDIIYSIDFIKGVLIDKMNSDKKNASSSSPQFLTLRFKSNFIFDGIQEGNKVISKYTKGLKNGIVLQTDSGIVGTRPIVVNKVDPRYLQFNVLKFYQSIESEPVYNLYNGIVFNFSNNLLDGQQKSFFKDGSIKFISSFKNGLCTTYESYNNQKQTITKLQCLNGIISGKQIINGIIKEFSIPALSWFNRINLTGSIEASSYVFDNYIEGAAFGIKFESDIIELNNFYRKSSLNPYQHFFREKNKLDSLKAEINGTVLLALLGIPYFSIHRFNFDYEENEIFESLKIDTNYINKETGSIFLEKIILRNDFYYYKSPFLDETNDISYDFERNYTETPYTKRIREKNYNKQKALINYLNNIYSGRNPQYFTAHKEEGLKALSDMKNALDSNILNAYETNEVNSDSITANTTKDLNKMLISLYPIMKNHLFDNDNDFPITQVLVNEFKFENAYIFRGNYFLLSNKNNEEFVVCPGGYFILKKGKHNVILSTGGNTAWIKIFNSELSVDIISKDISNFLN